MAVAQQHTGIYRKVTSDVGRNRGLLNLAKRSTGFILESLFYLEESPFETQVSFFNVVVRTENKDYKRIRPQCIMKYIHYNNDPFW